MPDVRSLLSINEARKFLVFVIPSRHDSILERVFTFILLSHVVDAERNRIGVFKSGIGASDASRARNPDSSCVVGADSFDRWASNCGHGELGQIVRALKQGMRSAGFAAQKSGFGWTCCLGVSIMRHPAEVMDK
jgi:hypothetical protein